jgi:Zn-dependent protease with chaperone function
MVSATPINAALPSARACPTCAAAVPLSPGYEPWCEACGWGLEPPRFDERVRLHTRIVATLGRRMGEGLFRSVQGDSALRPRLTLSAALGGVIALSVQLITLIVALLGVWLLWRGWPNLGVILLALICFWIAWGLRPRVAPLPAHPLPRETAPALYRLVDRIAGALGLPEPPLLVIDDSFNAAYGVVTWRRRSVVWLGLPLLALLSGQERAALIAHELAHGVNRDPQRSALIGWAITSLDAWHQSLRPTRIWMGGGLFGLAASLLSLLLFLVSCVPYGIAWLLLLLLFRSSQRAEYLADDLAARLAGGTALAGMLHVAYLAPFYTEVLRMIHFVGQRQQVITVLKQRVGALPERERRRYEQLAQRHDLRLDVSHPPTRFRIARLIQHHDQTPHLLLSPEESAQIEAELDPLMEALVVEDTRHLR